MEKNKIEYEKATIEVLEFSAEDVISTSNGGSFDGQPEPFVVF